MSAAYTCQRCKEGLSVSASLQHAIDKFEHARLHSGGSPGASGSFDTGSALAATGITGLLGVSTYDVIPRQPALSPRQQEKSRRADADDGEAQPAPQGGSATASESKGSGAQTGPAPAAAVNSAGDVTASVQVRSKLIDLLNSHNPPEPTPRPQVDRRLSSLSTASRRSQGGSSGGDPSKAKSGKKEEQLKIHHPLCQKCTEQLLEIMNDEVARLRKERDAFLEFDDFVTKRQQQPEHDEPGETLDEIREEVRALKEEQDAAEKELYASEREKSQLQKELDALEEEEKALAGEEEEFWHEYNQATLQLSELQDKVCSLQQSITLDTELLQRLRSINVYNDAFAIGHDSGFATINGLRFGRGSSANVDWAEVNAAWGQTVLLLDALARKCNFSFRGLKLHPKGSFSAIQRLPTGSSSGSAGGQGEMLELFNSAGWADTLSPWGKGRRYDKGMEAFLECMRQFMDYASKRDPQLHFPHVINRDRIGEVSIRLPSAFNQDDTWMRALRYVLVNMRALMRWVNGEDIASAPASRAA